MSDRKKRHVMTNDEKLIVGMLETHILEHLQESAKAYAEDYPRRPPRTWEAKALVKSLQRQYRFWDAHPIPGSYTRRPALIKAALGRLKAAGKLVTSPVVSRYARYKINGERYHPVQRWEYRLATSPLDALAALNPLG